MDAAGAGRSRSSSFSAIFDAIFDARLRTGFTRRAAVLALAATLGACGEAAVETEEPVRTIKPFFVNAASQGDIRLYSGEIVPADTASLSFTVAGTVNAVEVKQGDDIKNGDVLASLEAEPFELNVAAARSELASARAKYENARLNLSRQRQLYEKEWVAKAVLDQATAENDAAKGQFDLAESRLGLAERDLEKTKLRAPFDGVIAFRNIEPFVEVKAGEAIFQIDSQNAFEVEISVPDSVIGRVEIGAPVTIDAPALPECGCAGEITEIGVEASAANAVPVKAVVSQHNGGLVAGMGVEVGIRLAGGPGDTGFMAPLVAIAPGDEAAEGYVFKYDPDAGVVRKMPVRGDGSGVNGNLIGVAEGLEAGDVIAAAGVSFLRDGQRVKLLED